MMPFATDSKFYCLSQNRELRVEKSEGGQTYAVSLILFWFLLQA
jgi:hypothetical protein